MPVVSDPPQAASATAARAATLCVITRIRLPIQKRYTCGAASVLQP